MVYSGTITITTKPSLTRLELNVNVIPNGKKFEKN
jgi:hypothetical protein